MMGTILVVILVAVAVILVAGGLYYASKRRTARLKDYFGPEYERAMRQSDDKGAAEKELRERQQRVESFQLVYHRYFHV